MFHVAPCRNRYWSTTALNGVEPISHQRRRKVFFFLRFGTGLSWDLSSCSSFPVTEFSTPSIIALMLMVILEDFLMVTMIIMRMEQSCRFFFARHASACISYGSSGVNELMMLCLGIIGDGMERSDRPVAIEHIFCLF